MTYPSTQCPKCGRVLHPLGESIFQDEVMPLYGCPECITRRRVKGKVVELPLTFLLTGDGHYLDPSNPDGEIDRTPHQWIDSDGRWDASGRPPPP